MLEILLVDDEAEFLIPLAAELREEGHRVVTACDGESALCALGDHAFDALISDVRMRKATGFEVMQRARETQPGIRVILMTGVASVRDAVGAMKAGAVDYLPKPFDVQKLISLLRMYDRERQDAARGRDQELPGAKHGFLGRSPVVRALFERVCKFAETNAAVLISGESGTGKELVARMLHAQSPRAQKPFVAVNCGALPETLIEAELFGHERGAFTGAVTRRDGRFLAADGGTLFLDEVPELTLASQSKLLRVLQEGAFEPLGSDRTVTCDVRIISATHHDLKALAAAGRFREDLYYRLNALELKLPPLRNRGGDLRVLIDAFLRKHARPGPTPSISGLALAALADYAFPGNVRELDHIIERALVLCDHGHIDLEHLPPELTAADGKATESGVTAAAPLNEALRGYERAYLQRVVQHTNGRRTEAAKKLGISRKNLWEKLRKHGLTGAELGEDPKSIR